MKKDIEKEGKEEHWRKVNERVKRFAEENEVHNKKVEEKLERHRREALEKAEKMEVDGDEATGAAAAEAEAAEEMGDNDVLILHPSPSRLDDWGTSVDHRLREEREHFEASRSSRKVILVEGDLGKGGRDLGPGGKGEAEEKVKGEEEASLYEESNKKYIASSLYGVPG